MGRFKTEFLPPLILGAGIAALSFLAVVLVGRETSVTSAADAQISILAETTLSGASAARNAANFAVIVAAEEVGEVVVSNAIDHLGEASESLATRYERLGDHVSSAEREELAPLYSGFELATTALRDSLAAGEVDDAASSLSAQSDAYESFTAAVGELRDTHSLRILAAGENVGRVANAVRLLTIVLIPLALTLVFWTRLRKNSARRVLEAELEREREISRGKDRFVADISHELRTPLTGIYGFASALEESASDMPVSSREMLGLIVTEAAELSRMVDDLVVAGRLDAGAITYKIEDVELDAEIQEVLRPFRRRGVSVESEKMGIHARADRLRLRQVLRNLLSNAVKYGGPEIAIGMGIVGDRATIEVLDDGPGVPPEIQSRLFERYVHKHGSALLEGSVGLGLAIAGALAEGMGGDLSYKRIDGITVFEVSLPLSEMELATAQAPGGPGNANSGDADLS